MRASIYNAMPLEGVQALVDYMREFEQKHRRLTTRRPSQPTTLPELRVQIDAVDSNCSPAEPARGAGQ
jgi:hypothetical protein